MSSKRGRNVHQTDETCIGLTRPITKYKRRKFVDKFVLSRKLRSRREQYSFVLRKNKTVIRLYYLLITVGIVTVYTLHLYVVRLRRSSHTLITIIVWIAEISKRKKDRGSFDRLLQSG